MLAADKVLIVGDFNIHVDNEKDALGSAFIDILNLGKYHQEMRGYADDTQLYIYSRPGEAHQIEKLMECIVDIKSGWQVIYYC